MPTCCNGFRGRRQGALWTFIRWIVIQHTADDQTVPSAHVVLRTLCSRAVSTAPSALSAAFCAALMPVTPVMFMPA